MNNLYIILSFHPEITVYSGGNTVQLFGMMINEHHININELHKFEGVFGFKVGNFVHEREKSSYCTSLFEYSSIIAIINKLIEMGEYNIASISENKHNEIKYHLVKNTNKINDQIGRASCRERV